MMEFEQKTKLNNNNLKVLILYTVLINNVTF